MSYLKQGQENQQRIEGQGRFNLADSVAIRRSFLRGIIPVSNSGRYGFNRKI
jgi:hypothetical protein